MHEYQWGVYVNVYNNQNTGNTLSRYRGADYVLLATHIVSQPDSPVTQPIADGVRVDVWSSAGGEYWTNPRTATLVVDTQADTLTLTGRIPGISSS